jgi:cell division septation protein DedD
MHGHPGPVPGHYTPYPGPHAPPPRPAGFNRGRALPVMVACGLAMGVFVGLVVVRGTGEAEGAVTATVTPPARAASPDAAKPAEAKPADTNPAEAKPADAKPADAKPADAKPPEPPPAADTRALLTFNVTPPDAVVTVDGAKVAGGKVEVKLVDGKKRVRLVAKADGYRSYDKSHLVTDDEAISIELVKRPRRSSSSKGPSGPGGLIDLR